MGCCCLLAKVILEISETLKVDQGGSPTTQHQLSAQRWADDINMSPNAEGTFKRPLQVFRYTKGVFGFPSDSSNPIFYCVVGREIYKLFNFIIWLLNSRKYNKSSDHWNKFDVIFSVFQRKRGNFTMSSQFHGIPTNCEVGIAVCLIEMNYWSAKRLNFNTLSSKLSY